jgi:hypothetical protein
MGMSRVIIIGKRCKQNYITPTLTLPRSGGGGSEAEGNMLSEKMGRRKFMKNMSLAFGGAMASQFFGDLPSAHAEEKPILEYRTLGRRD